MASQLAGDLIIMAGSFVFSIAVFFSSRIYTVCVTVYCDVFL